jgi:hypothetical protein
MATRKTIQETSTIFRQHNGILRTSEALELGVHPRMCLPTIPRSRPSGGLFYAVIA